MVGYLCRKILDFFTPKDSKGAGAQMEEMDNDLREAALEYHRLPTPGKISVRPTKALINQHDLALAYSPGVAFACEAIVDDPNNAALYTSRANLVGVVTNGLFAVRGADVLLLAAPGGVQRLDAR